MKKVIDYMVRYILTSAMTISFLLNSQAVDPAALFPVDSLAFVEIRNAAKLAEGWSQIVKGTSLDGTIPTSAERRDRSADINQLTAIETLGRIGLLATPEAQIELKRLGGIAFGLTGFDALAQPEFAAVVLTGESTVAGLMAKSFVTTQPDLRRVKSIGDISIFQFRPPPNQIAGADGRPVPIPVERAKPEERQYAYASTPGLFVVGSSPQSVESVLKRFAGTEKSSLLQSKSFQTWAESRAKADLVAFLEPAKGFSLWDAAHRKLGDDVDDTLNSWLRFVVNPNSIQTAMLTGQLISDGWVLNVAVDQKPNVPSPIFDLIGTNSVQATGPGGHATVAISNDSSPFILKSLDAVAKAQGLVGRLPSDVVKQAEKISGVKWSSELIPTIESISGSREGNDYVLNTTLNRAPEAWDGVWPGLFRAMNADDKPVTPAVEIFDGFKVNSFATPLAWCPTVHLLRSGNRIALSTSRSALVRAVKWESTRPTTSAAFLASIPSEWLVPGDDRKSADIKIPFLPKPTLKELLSRSPAVQIAANRTFPQRVTVEFSQLGWSNASSRKAIAELVVWLEMNLAHILNPTQLPDAMLGGIVK